MRDILDYIKDKLGFHTDNKSPKVVIVGGGTSGIVVGAQLNKAGVKNITIIEPNEYHYFQPGFTLVTSGLMKKERARRKLKDVIPRKSTWIHDAVIGFSPGNNEVITEKSGPIKYDYLVVAAGLDHEWNAIKGLPENLGMYGIATNYTYDHLDNSKDAVDSFAGGVSLFVQPNNTIQLANPQKIMFLLDDIWKKKRVPHSTTLYTPHDEIQGSPYYEGALTDLCTNKGIDRRFHHSLLEVNGREKYAVFKDMRDNNNYTVPFNFIHVIPPLAPRKFIKNSILADADGMVKVDNETLIHPDFPNILSLGDCSSLPVPKTCSAVSVQAPILVHNLVNLIGGGKSEMKRYEGYASIPILTETGPLGKALLCEYGYGFTPHQCFLKDQRQQTIVGYYLKSFLIPYIYWYGLLTGRYKCHQDSRVKGFF
jgi:sulfide:quinone oxidoreductase